ncbi:MAG: TerD family protein [Clostridia bacterium]|nr:TerD family protein [Clostridia bacterium]
MRKFEHRINGKDMICAVLDQCYVMSVSVNDGETPYTLPLCFGYIPREDGIDFYMHTGADGKIVNKFKERPQVFMMTYILYHDLVKYYRQDYHDYRSVMCKGVVEEEINIGQFGREHGDAVQAMLKHYKRPRNHFDVPHYMWMRLWRIHCKWEDIDAKAESPIDRIEDVPFPGPNDPIDDRPPEYERIYVTKYPQKPYENSLPGAEAPAPAVEGPAAISANNIEIECAWDDDPEHGHVDLDFYGLFLKEGRKMERRYDLVFHKAPASIRTTAVKFLGDDMENVLGREAMEADLAKLGEDYESMALCLSVYDAPGLNKCLGCVKNIRVTIKDKTTGEPLMRSTVKASMDGKQAMQIGLIEKSGDSWMFIPEEKGYDDWRQPHVFAEYGLVSWRE